MVGKLEGRADGIYTTQTEVYKGDNVVGTVTHVQLNRAGDIFVELQIDSLSAVSNGMAFRVITLDILGGKGIELFGDATSNVFLQNGDTVLIQQEIIDPIKNEEAIQLIESLTDSIFDNLLISEEDI